MTDFAVREGNVVEVPSDLLLLKHAQAFYGADQVVASRLISAGLCTEAELRPAPGDFVVIETKGSIAPKRVLFLGTPPLRSLSYNEIGLFARNAVEKIVDLDLLVQNLTTTIHGGGYGLDRGEALQRLVRSFRLAFDKQKVKTIQTVTFLTLNKRKERMLQTALEEIATTIDTTADTPITESSTLPETQSKGHRPTLTEIPSVSSLGASPIVNKRRVFVALPFSEEFQNVYEFGIYPAVRSCGFICERVDETHFTGDVLIRIRGAIESADLVIADLTEGRPNVYLEVGYAWGRGIPVIFVAKKGEMLHFDVSTHRCIFYGKFTQFAKDLEQLIRGIEAQG